MSWNTIITTAIPSIIVLLLGGGIGALGYLYRSERERREAGERQLSEDKRKVYVNLMNVHFETIKATKDKKDIDLKALTDRMLDIKEELILYGSDEVFKTFQKWSDSPPGSKENVIEFGRLIVAIRRDMGNGRTKITTEEVLRVFITDYDQAIGKRIK